ncbi:hypothetical protein ABKN59_006259 [Abortiporus biennis]
MLNCARFRLYFVHAFSSLPIIDLRPTKATSLLQPHFVYISYERTPTYLIILWMECFTRIPELYDASIYYLRHDRQSLLNCSLVCRSWSYAARRYLLSSILVLVGESSSIFGYEQLQHLLESSTIRLPITLNVGSHVKHLQLRGRYTRHGGRFSKLPSTELLKILEKLPLLQVLELRSLEIEPPQSYSSLYHCSTSSSLPYRPLRHEKDPTGTIHDNEQAIWSRSRRGTGPPLRNLILDQVKVGDDVQTCIDFLHFFSAISHLSLSDVFFGDEGEGMSTEREGRIVTEEEILSPATVSLSSLSSSSTSASSSPGTVIQSHLQLAYCQLRQSPYVDVFFHMISTLPTKSALTGLDISCSIEHLPSLQRLFQSMGDTLLQLRIDTEWEFSQAWHPALNNTTPVLPLDLSPCTNLQKLEIRRQLDTTQDEVSTSWSFHLKFFNTISPSLRELSISYRMYGGLEYDQKLLALWQWDELDALLSSRFRQLETLKFVKNHYCPEKGIYMPKVLAKPAAQIVSRGLRSLNERGVLTFNSR